MKRLKVVFMVLLFPGFFSAVYAQQRHSGLLGAQVLDARPLAVTFYKTTSLVFPYDVLDYDYGSNGLIVEQTKRAKNILRVKAAKKGFEQTNLSVILGDGSFYSFEVDYAEDVNQCTYFFESDEGDDVANVQYDLCRMEEVAAAVKDARPFLSKRSKKDQVALVLQGIYAADQLLWLRMRCVNHSAMDFRSAYVRFVIKDRKRVKRHAMQETEISPVHLQLADTVRPGCREDIIAAFEPFAMTSRKELFIQVTDKSNRDVTLKMRPVHLRRARAISE